MTPVAIGDIQRTEGTLKTVYNAKKPFEALILCLHLLEKHPNMYQQEIAMMSEENSGRFPLLAITNLDPVKTLHLAKGEVVGFAIPESSEVTYIATTNELNIKEVIDVKPRNWIPQ